MNTPASTAARTTSTPALPPVARRPYTRAAQLPQIMRERIVVLDGANADLAAASGDRWLDHYIFAGGRRLIDRVLVGGEDIVTRGRHRAHDAIAARYGRTLARLVSA